MIHFVQALQAGTPFLASLWHAGYYMVPQYVIVNYIESALINHNVRN